MCAIPDSDKPAMVMRFPDRIVGCPTGLWVEDGKLLLSYRKTRQATPGAEWSTQGSQVVALEPGSPAHYTFDTAPLPSKGSVVSADGRYLYYTVHEERKSAFDFLSENDTQRSYTCLYRTPWRPFRQ
jgi:hypothetical protein